MDKISPIAPRVPFLSGAGKTNQVSREWYAFFNQTRTVGNGLADATVLTADDQTTAFPNSQVLTPVDGELTHLLTGSNYELGLADTAITPGDYGDEKHLVKVTFDAKGRATAAEEFELNSDNVTEGTHNLFYTDARARAALSAGTGIHYDNATGVIAVADTAVSPGTYGSSNKSARITVNQQGQITAASEQTITIASVAGAAPIADGVHPCGTGFITTVNGIITAIT